MVLTVATIVLSALLAATVPTLRALRINPIDVLRADH
jgi:ABC-type lipoprotein release transport system permease subunit